MADEKEATTLAELPKGELSNEQLIAQRSADIDTETADEHRKVFVLPPGPKPTEANGFDHRANYAATREYAVQAGLRPTGDVRLVSTKAFGPGGTSWALTYAVPVVPAERASYTPDEPVEVVTEHETDKTGNVPTTTDGTGTTPNSDPEGTETGAPTQPTA